MVGSRYSVYLLCLKKNDQNQSVDTKKTSEGHATNWVKWQILACPSCPWVSGSKLDLMLVVLNSLQLLWEGEPGCQITGEYYFTLKRTRWMELAGARVGGGGDFLVGRHEYTWPCLRTRRRTNTVWQSLAPQSRLCGFCFELWRRCLSLLFELLSPKEPQDNCVILLKRNRACYKCIICG